jgi:hypothetical protein
MFQIAPSQVWCTNQQKPQAVFPNQDVPRNLKGGNCIVVFFCLHLSFAVDQSLKQLRELGNVQIHFGNAHGLCKQYTS